MLNKKDDWVEDRNYTYIRIDKRRRINDVVNDLRALFAEQDRLVESVSPYPIIGTPICTNTPTAIGLTRLPSVITEDSSTRLAAGKPMETKILPACC